MQIHLSFDPEEVEELAASALVRAREKRLTGPYKGLIEEALVDTQTTGKEYAEALAIREQELLWKWEAVAQKRARCLDTIRRGVLFGLAALAGAWGLDHPYPFLVFAAVLALLVFVPPVLMKMAISLSEWLR